QFRAAIDLDPSFARAYSALALASVDDFRYQWSQDSGRSAELALDLATKAVALDKELPQAHWVLGYVHLFGNGNHEQALAMGQRTIALDPNHADGYALLAVTHVYAGQSERARALISEAMRLNPDSPSQYAAVLGYARFFSGDYTGARRALEQALEINVNRLMPNLYLTATYVRLNEIDDGRWHAENIRQANPEFDLEHWASRQPFKDQNQLESVVRDLRTAGL
ncbi:MAG: tetratricopeptide repeat protein, partial [Pseudomonadota bacterium]